jgi:hypothetical protein
MNDRETPATYGTVHGDIGRSRHHPSGRELQISDRFGFVSMTDVSVLTPSYGERRSTRDVGLPGAEVLQTRDDRQSIKSAPAGLGVDSLCRSR